MKKKIVLAADLGGTNLRMAAVEPDGTIIYRARSETPRAEHARQIISTITKTARECIEFVNEKYEVTAIAAAVPATVNAEKGIILKAPNVSALNNFNICDALETELELDCVLENDANAAALGESWLGASKGIKSSICVTLGTGVGGGIIIEGKILRGADGTAGEIGHICVEPYGAACGCGSRGCIEQYASATAIVRLIDELKDKFPKSILTELKSPTALDVYKAGKLEDELALEAFRRQGFYLGITLSGLLNVLNPEAIVIGGGAANGWDLFAPSMFEQINERAYDEPTRRAKIVRAQLGDDAGILGAARLAFD